MVGSLPVGSNVRSPLPLSMSCTKQCDFLMSRPQPADQPRQNNVTAIIHLQQLTAGYNRLHPLRSGHGTQPRNKEDDSSDLWQHQVQDEAPHKV